MEMTTMIRIVMIMAMKSMSLDEKLLAMIKATKTPTNENKRNG